MEFFTKFLDKFEEFIKRAMMPSVVFFVMFIGMYLLFNYTQNPNNFKTITTQLESILSNLISNLNIGTFVLFFILLVALSHILAVLTQLVFDNNIKENYEPEIFKNSELKNLKLLRKEVKEKIKKESPEFKDIDLTDFMLYQIISRKLRYLNEKTPTHRYVDDAKASGIVFISIIISFFINTSIYFNLTIAISISILTWFVGFTYIKSKYRSRALRIYTNYLIGEEKEKDLSEKESKLIMPKNTKIFIQKS